MSADWFEGVAGYWSKQRDDGQPDLIFTEDEIDDWPPLVALRAEVARLTLENERMTKALIAHEDCCCTDMWPELLAEPENEA